MICAHISLDLHVYCTSATAIPSDTKQEVKSSKRVQPAKRKSKSRKLENMLSVSDISIQTCRPNLASIVSGALKKNTSSVAAFVCGPSNLVDEVKTVCQKHRVDLHTEIFQF